MTSPHHVALVLSCALAGAAVTAATSAGEAWTAASPERVTAAGVGAVELGARYRTLRAAGRVGRLRAGCELDPARPRAAALRGRLRGGATFNRRPPRRVTHLYVTRGAAARGVGIGDRRREIRAAFPHARFDASTRETFGITLVRIPKRDGGRFDFALDVSTKRITGIGVPRIRFCE